MAVIVERGLVAQLGADAVHPDRLGAGHLAHQIDIMHAAIDDRRQRFHQVLVPVPGRPVTLLVQVHAHHQGLAEGLGDLDQLGPGRMVAQDVAEHQLLVVLPRLDDDPLGIGDVGRDRLLHEHVAARLERPNGIVGMGVGIGIDRDGVRAGLGQRHVEILEPRDLREALGQIGAALDRPAHQPDALEAVERLVGFGVRQAHVADADDQHLHVVRHL